MQYRICRGRRVVRTIDVAVFDEILPGATSAERQLIFRYALIVPADCGDRSSHDYVPRGALE